MKRKTIPLLKIIISKTKVAIFADKSPLANEQNKVQNRTKYKKSQHSTEAEVGHFLYFDCKTFWVRIFARGTQ